MKIYCAIVQYMFTEEVNDFTKVSYVGLDLACAVQELLNNSETEDGWIMDASYIQVWKYGIHISTLKGNGEEWDWEN